MKQIRILGLMLVLLVALTASIGLLTIETKTIYAKALTDHECDTGEWHFVINQINEESNAPTSILVTWGNAGESVQLEVALDKFTGGVAHYTTSAYLNKPVTKAKASIYFEWGGQFNLSHGPCTFAEPTPTSTETPPETTPTITPDPTPTDPPPTSTPDPTPPTDNTPTVPPPTETKRPTITPTSPPPPPLGIGPVIAPAALKTEFLIADRDFSIPSVGIETLAAEGRYDGDWIMSAFYYDATYWPEFNLVGLHSPFYDELYDVEIGDLIYFDGEPYVIYETVLIDSNSTTWVLGQADLTVITCYGPNWNQRFVAYAEAPSLLEAIPQ